MCLCEKVEITVASYVLCLSNTPYHVTKPTLFICYFYYLISECYESEVVIQDIWSHLAA